MMEISIIQMSRVVLMACVVVTWHVHAFRGLGALVFRQSHSKHCHNSKTSTPTRGSFGNNSLRKTYSSLSSRHISMASALQNDERGRKITQDILARVRQVNCIPPEIKKSLLPFRVDGIELGQVRPNMAEKLCSISGMNGPVFNIEDTSSTSFLTLASAAGETYESRSRAVEVVAQSLKNEGIITGWRDELFPVTPSFYEPALFEMERAAVPYLGAIEYGVHINGLVQGKDGEILMWMARRAANKQKYPGFLDHIAAGGQPVGLTLTENVVKECYEEAGISEEITRAGLRSAGVVSYERYNLPKDLVEQAVIFNFDLQLPPEFQPKPMDGEVQDFFVWSMDDLLDSMALDYKDPIKPNCYTVIIDFLLRNGYLNPEIAGFLDIERELRGGWCR